jgi:hypothetical protein
MITVTVTVTVSTVLIIYIYIIQILYIYNSPRYIILDIRCDFALLRLRFKFILLGVRRQERVEVE